MDVILAQDHIKPFCQAIAQLSRIGKEVYFDFLPTEGLQLRSLNDAKSAFASFHFEPSFFQRCTSSTTTLLNKNNNRKRASPASSSSMADEDRYMVKVPVKTLAALIRTRKNPLQLRIVTTSSTSSSSTRNRSSISSESLLTFEYQVQPPQGSLIHIVHRVGVADAQGIVAMAPTDGATELVADPNVLSKLLEPLKNTAEVAFVVQDDQKLIRALTFHADNVILENNGGDDPATVIRNPLSKPTPLSTETSIGTEDLKEYYYVSSYDDDGSNDDPDNERHVPPPTDLSEKVIMVVSRKEVRALLQFAAHAFSDQPLAVHMHFYYGGKPMVLTTGTEGCTSQLILATLDHRKLGTLQLNNTAGAAAAAAANHQHQQRDETSSIMNASGIQQMAVAPVLQ
jgi:hypothetical protein